MVGDLQDLQPLDPDPWVDLVRHVVRVGFDPATACRPQSHSITPLDKAGSNGGAGARGRRDQIMLEVSLSVASVSRPSSS